MDKLQSEITIEQGQATVEALDVYTRLCIGQLDAVVEMVCDGTIPMRADSKGPRVVADADAIEHVRALMNQVKVVLGYAAGGSNGIGHRHVAQTGHRAYEIKKVFERVIALHRNPAPSFRGVNYDGLVVRYTQDPAPEAKIVSYAES